MILWSTSLDVNQLLKCNVLDRFTKENWRHSSHVDYYSSEKKSFDLSIKYATLLAQFLAVSSMKTTLHFGAIFGSIIYENDITFSA